MKSKTAIIILTVLVVFSVFFVTFLYYSENPGIKDRIRDVYIDNEQTGEVLDPRQKAIKVLEDMQKVDPVSEEDKRRAVDVLEKMQNN